MLAKGTSGLLPLPAGTGAATSDESSATPAGGNKELRMRVFCRVRPAHPGEIDGKTSYNVVDLDLPNAAVRVNSREYTFDAVLPGTLRNADVYAACCRDLVDHAMNGLTGTLMCYGQTGTGKTHTMSNRGQRDPGVLLLAMQEVFARARALDAKNRASRGGAPAVKVRLSYIQLYRDNLQDLLDKDTPFLALRADTSRPAATSRGGKDMPGTSNSNSNAEGDNVPIVDAALSPPLQTFEQFMTHYEFGDRNRVVAETKMNKSSSRGHSVLTVFVTQQITIPSPHDPTATVTREITGRLVFVDLAGYERLNKTMAEGLRKDEAKHINLSLSALANVMHSITFNNPHVPWRNSKLTRLMKNSLSGNSATSIILTLGPSSAHLTETVNTLYFGHNAIQCKTTVHVIFADLDYKKEYANLLAMVKTLRERNKELESALASTAGGNRGTCAQAWEQQQQRQTAFDTPSEASELQRVRIELEEALSKGERLEEASAALESQLLDADELYLETEGALAAAQRGAAALRSQLDAARVRIAQLEGAQGSGAASPTNADGRNGAAASGGGGAALFGLVGQSELQTAVSAHGSNIGNSGAAVLQQPGGFAPTSWDARHEAAAGATRMGAAFVSTPAVMASDPTVPSAAVFPPRPRRRVDEDSSVPPTAESSSRSSSASSSGSGSRSSSSSTESSGSSSASSLGSSRGTTHSLVVSSTVIDDDRGAALVVAPSDDHRRRHADRGRERHRRGDRDDDRRGLNAEGAHGVSALHGRRLLWLVEGEGKDACTERWLAACHATIDEMWHQHRLKGGQEEPSGRRDGDGCAAARLAVGKDGGDDDDADGVAAQRRRLKQLCSKERSTETIKADRRKDTPPPPPPPPLVCTLEDVVAFLHALSQVAADAKVALTGVSTEESTTAVLARTMLAKACFAPAAAPFVSGSPAVYIGDGDDDPHALHQTPRSVAAIAASPLFPRFPRVCDVAIDGDAVEGELLTARYTYTGSALEGATRLRWYLHSTIREVVAPPLLDDASAQQQQQPPQYRFTERVEVVADGTPTYRCTTSDIGRLLLFEVIPVSTEGEIGAAVVVRTTVTVQACVPSAQNLRITGDPVLGEVLTASYDFEGGEEGDSVVRWYRSVDGGVYHHFHSARLPERDIIVRSDLVDHYVRVQITPVRSDRVKGNPVVSKIVYVNVSPQVDSVLRGFVRSGAAEFSGVALLDAVAGNSEEPPAKSLRSPLGVLRIDRENGMTFRQSDDSFQRAAFVAGAALGGTAAGGIPPIRGVDLETPFAVTIPWTDVHPLVLAGPDLMQASRFYMSDGQRKGDLRCLFEAVDANQRDLIVLAYRVFFSLSIPAVREIVLGSETFFEDTPDAASRVDRIASDRRMQIAMANGDVYRPGSTYSFPSQLVEAMLLIEGVIGPSRRSTGRGFQAQRVPLLVPSQGGVFF